MKRTKGRDPKRLSKILQARADRLTIPIEVVPLEVIPKPVLRKAVLHPRRAKGVPKTRRVFTPTKGR